MTLSAKLDPSGETRTFTFKAAPELAGRIEEAAWQARAKTSEWLRAAVEEKLAREAEAAQKKAAAEARAAKRKAKPAKKAGKKRATRRIRRPRR